jgi:hypothetical protein
MEYIMFLIAITCSNPKYYTLFETQGSNEGIERIRCENNMKDCYNFSGSYPYCLNNLDEIDRGL